jgi:hypothetical protein
MKKWSRHGDCASPEYRAWLHMNDRCRNPKNPAWFNYGGRGIAVYDEWRNSYKTFLVYVGRRPSSKHTIDRYPDRNGNYEPGNVRWATRSEQSRNTRRNVLITVKNQTRCLAHWAQLTGISSSTVRYRIKKGMSFKNALKQRSLRRKGADGKWIRTIGA